MTPDAVRALARNPFFLARVYGPVRGVDVEEELDVTGDHVDEVDSLTETEGRTIGDDDGDLVTRCIGVPIVLPGGFQWDVEYWDNGEDAGVTHLLREGDAEPVTIAEIDAHPRGERLRWTDAMRVIEAARRDARNAACADALPLLLRSAIALDAAEDVVSAREAVATAWRAVGVDADVAATIASSSIAATSTKQGSSSDAAGSLTRLLEKLET